MGERCGCSFSTLPGKQLRCVEATRHQGPHHADGVTWPQLFPKRSEEVPDGRRLGLEGRAPATTAAPTLDPAEATKVLRSLRATYPKGHLLAFWAEAAAIGADALEANQTLRDKVAEYENAITWGTSCLSCAKILDASIADHQRAEKAEDKIADLEIYAAELADLIAGFEWACYGYCPACDIWKDNPNGHAPDCRLAHALAPPQHRQQLQDKVERLREALIAVDHPHLLAALDQGEAQGGDHGG